MSSSPFDNAICYPSLASPASSAHSKLTLALEGLSAAAVADVSVSYKRYLVNMIIILSLMTKTGNAILTTHNHSASAITKVTATCFAIAYVAYCGLAWYVTFTHPDQHQGVGELYDLFGNARIVGIGTVAVCACCELFAFRYEK